MNIPITSITVNRQGNWTFNWSATPGATFNVVLFGIQLIQTINPTYTFTGQGYNSFPPPLEVTILPDQALSQQFIPFMYLQWYGEPASDHYLIQQSQDSGVTWQTIDTFQELGQWIYSYQTTTQTDEVTYLYQVIAVDSIGNNSIPRMYSRYVVCPPIAPDGEIVIGYLNPFVIVSAAQ